LEEKNQITAHIEDMHGQDHDQVVAWVMRHCSVTIQRRRSAPSAPAMVDSPWVTRCVLELRREPAWPPHERVELTGAVYTRQEVSPGPPTLTVTDAQGRAYVFGSLRRELLGDLARCLERLGCHARESVAGAGAAPSTLDQLRDTLRVEYESETSERWLDLTGEAFHHLTCAEIKELVVRPVHWHLYGQYHSSSNLQLLAILSDSQTLPYSTRMDQHGV
jgi:hypothetical protein